MNTWELPLAVAATLDIEVLVIIPESREDHHTEINDLAWRFHLDKNRSGFLFFHTPAAKSAKAAWPERDKEIAAISDRIIPISIRPAGNMEGLINQYPAKILDRFQIPYAKTFRPRPKYADYECRTDLSEDDFLIHFTRSVPGPWPDETDFDYYRAVIDSRDDYCRSAAKTLLHILESGTIYASARNIRDQHQVVGFTRFSPEHISDLFRYRPRLVNPYFEPYGIGFPVEAAVRAGCRPVQYSPPEIYPTLDPADRPFFQNKGGDSGRWTTEQEWRSPGDFDLDQIPENERCIFVPDEDEAALFRDRLGRRVESLSRAHSYPL